MLYPIDAELGRILGCVVVTGALRQDAAVSPRLEALALKRHGQGVRRPQ